MASNSQNANSHKITLRLSLNTQGSLNLMESRRLKVNVRYKSKALLIQVICQMIVLFTQRITCKGFTTISAMNLGIPNIIIEADRKQRKLMTTGYSTYIIKWTLITWIWTFPPLKYRMNVVNKATWVCKISLIIKISFEKGR